MTELATLSAYGELIEPLTLKIQRLLPGPVDRVWAYLTQSELRRQWLASGQMEMKAGTPFELVWRNDELSDPPGTRPEGFGAEHRLESRILALEPNRKLAIAWNQGEVSFELEPAGDKVLLTITHRRLPDRAQLLNVSAGWHAHLDVLVTKIGGKPQTASFWDTWSKLKAEYEKRLPA
ncbi:SRPBCC family protein [Caulobacter sp. UNC279MFTsu5.1]|uniref:SRPBCC family protein n=1 Tax=Caulobacter sp. UNC279MFTsu5.1 TaxID=1502775 RepID=UPI0008EF8047|nr:SRPBCC family protein [Caulobacter sp. UNC279MFTsu5.1]SFJ13853.1 Uncharacterized conserved protein YndB, AHSA1/START domain [Caulobacter sp. UNC279MFTsu5.1]